MMKSFDTESLTHNDRFKKIKLRQFLSGSFNITGSLNVTGSVEFDKNISGSITSTGSFSRLQSDTISVTHSPFEKWFWCSNLWT